MNTKQSSDHSGFTLIELTIIIAILGVLTHIAMVSFIHLTQKARDTAAKSDTKNLMDVVTNNFINNQGIDYSPAGSNEAITIAGAVGTPPVYTLSPGVKARISGHTGPNSINGYGFFEAFVYHELGTKDPTTDSKRMEYYCLFDEQLDTYISTF